MRNIVGEEKNTQIGFGAAVEFSLTNLNMNPFRR